MEKDKLKNKGNNANTLLCADNYVVLCITERRYDIGFLRINN